MLNFNKLSKEMYAELVKLLTSETWPFHGHEMPSEDMIRESITNGYYTENGNETFLITMNDETIGMIRIFDLADPTCLFDLRLKNRYRGKGFGSICVNWLSRYVFKNFAHIVRIEAHTRHDNYAMRKTLYNCGYVKEAYHRNGWPQGGILHDGVGYTIIRSDWEKNTVTCINDSFPY
ncbi:GNAT family protein [Bacillus sp. SM2101]|uniref:GNAT family N-acetyltransferase n=1 Tax=Bacillus sp. SM2101 TaxID=2805366 RepID=UPI001BDE5CCF